MVARACVGVKLEGGMWAGLYIWASERIGWNGGFVVRVHNRLICKFDGLFYAFDIRRVCEEPDFLCNL